MTDPMNNPLRSNLFLKEGREQFWCRHTIMWISTSHCKPTDSKITTKMTFSWQRENKLLKMFISFLINQVLTTVSNSKHKINKYFKVKVLKVQRSLSTSVKFQYNFRNQNCLCINVKRKRETKKGKRVYNEVHNRIVKICREDGWLIGKLKNTWFNTAFQHC